MKPIKPKYTNTVKVEWRLSRRSREIIAQYAKYTHYDESEIVEKLLDEIIEDEAFVKWLKRRRYQKKTNALIFGEVDAENNLDALGNEVEFDESVEEAFNS